MEATRFAFGENWRKFNAALTDDQRAAARTSLADWLGNITGMSFLDIGAGSGLFSAAASELGAHVRAFDFDPAHEGVERGDVLDRAFMESLGQFDIVYSWGVLHHTGAMWRAIENAAGVVAPGGRMFISIYNDQGARSHLWRQTKRLYNHLPRAVRPVYAAAVISPWELKRAVRLTLARHSYLATWRAQRNRGMSRWRDIVDWVGGYPFEVATADVIVEFCKRLGLTPLRVLDKGGSGCNEFLFQRHA